MKNNILDFIRQVLNSFAMDLRFIKASGFSGRKDLQYISEKYKIKLRHMFTPFKLGKDHAKLSNQDLYYDSQYGLSGHQSVFLDDIGLIKKSRITGLKTIIDIGANVGYLTLGLSELFPSSTIYSLEPIENIYQCLLLNTASSKNIKPFNIALGDKPGVATMAFNQSDTVFSKIISSKDVNGIKVKVDTLDNFARKNRIGRIDLLTIDTETFEASVLEGGVASLAITKYIMIEVTIKDNPNYSFSSLVRLLSNDKFDFQLLDFSSHGRDDEGRIIYMDLLLENRMLAKDTANAI